MATERPIRVLVVDDSALVRKIITTSLASVPGIEVVGTAPDPYIARDKLLALNPDVMTLDLEMPRMDGLTFLRLIMKHRPMPVVVFSSLTGPGSSKALEALQAGAVEVLGKPGSAFSAYEDGNRLAEKIRGAAQARVRPSSPTPPQPAPTEVRQASTEARHASAEVRRVEPGVAQPQVAPAVPPLRRAPGPRELILMGASTGGTEALKEVLRALPGNLPGICIVQHIPAYFSRAFANRLNELCEMEVREAQHGDEIKAGLALVAPGGQHLCVRWMAGRYVAELNEGPQVHHQRPAVDILFDSAAKAGAGPHSQVVLLTGMGADGARGMLVLRQAGATTIAQNEETCVVFGMPREAIRMGAAQKVLPLGHIAAEIVRKANAAAS